MKNPRFSTPVIKERLKLFIAANCRSDLPVRNKGMQVLAAGAGVYTSPSTVEMDLLAYVDQLNSSSIIRAIFEWCKAVAQNHEIRDLPQRLPQFELELM